MANGDAGTRAVRAILCSGHMIDVPGRAHPRFPAGKEGAVARAMRRVLDGWGVGPKDVGISGAARGADILFAEAMLERGAHVKLLIALPEAQFIEQSVQLPDTGWEQRYRSLRSRCETHFQHEEWRDRYPQLDAFSRNNLWCIEMAEGMAASPDISALLVWDGRDEGDGPGGTADFAARIKSRGGRVAIVDPMSA